MKEGDWEGEAEAALGVGLLTLLPSFETLPLDEILDIRTDAVIPLRSYRQAVAKASAEIRQSPWSPSFEREVRRVWRTQVRPALSELEDHFASAAFLKQLVPQLSKPADLLSKGAIAFVAGSLTTRSLILGSGFGVAAATVEAAGAALMESRRERLQARANDFYLVHVVSRAIGAVSGDSLPETFRAAPL